jgi:hypothetical protein
MPHNAAQPDLFAALERREPPRRVLERTTAPVADPFDSWDIAALSRPGKPDPELDAWFEAAERAWNRGLG